MSSRRRRPGSSSRKPAVRQAGMSCLPSTTPRGRAFWSSGLGLKERREMTEGDRAPAITVTASDGSTIKLAAPGQPLVLYFYPKDDTSGCTREAQDFTASAGEFNKAGVKVIGVSRDPMKKHEKFIDKYGLAVPLVSDEDGHISDAF